MRIAYFDCPSGISGDMTLGALVDAGADLGKIAAGVTSLGLPDVKISSSEVKKKGFRGTQIKIEHPPEHAHRHLHHIVAMIEKSQMTSAQQELARRIFLKIAEAEAKVHGSTPEKIHFHEVGAIDSIVDICGVAIGLDLLGVDRIVASPVPTGTGYVQIAHGRCSVPAPATAEMLKGIPLADCPIVGELTTPTGAAILATVVDSYGALPAMRIEQIGYGAGTMELKEQANLLRLVVGEADDPIASDQVWVLETNLDDTAGELVGFCTTKLWEAQALDVYTTPIQMKKNRPGVTLTVLCHSQQIAKMEKIIFRETHTLGIRRWPVSRHKLERQPLTVQTDLGPIEGKLGWIAGQPPCFSPEYESCAKVANERGIPLKDVYEAAQRAFDPAAINIPGRKK